MRPFIPAVLGAEGSDSRALSARAAISVSLLFVMAAGSWPGCAASVVQMFSSSRSLNLADLLGPRNSESRLASGSRREVWRWMSQRITAEGFEGPLRESWDGVSLLALLRRFVKERAPREQNV